MSSYICPSLSAAFGALGLYGNHKYYKSDENSQKLKNNIVQIDNIDTIKHKSNFILNFNNNSDAAFLWVSEIQSKYPLREKDFIKKILNPTLKLNGVTALSGLKEPNLNGVQFPSISDSFYGDNFTINRELKNMSSSYFLPPNPNHPFATMLVQLWSFKDINNAHLLVNKSNGNLTYHAIGDPDYLVSHEAKMQKNTANKMRCVGGIGFVSFMMASFYIK
jgi:hypothetical protein